MKASMQKHGLDDLKAAYMPAQIIQMMAYALRLWPSGHLR